MTNAVLVFGICLILFKPVFLSPTLGIVRVIPVVFPPPSYLWVPLHTGKFYQVFQRNCCRSESGQRALMDALLFSSFLFPPEQQSIDCFLRSSNCCADSVGPQAPPTPSRGALWEKTRLGGATGPSSRGRGVLETAGQFLGEEPGGAPRGKHLAAAALKIHPRPPLPRRDPSPGQSHSLLPFQACRARRRLASLPPSRLSPAWSPGALAPCHCHHLLLPPPPGSLRPSSSAVSAASFRLFTAVFSSLITRLMTTLARRNRATTEDPLRAAALTSKVLGSSPGGSPSSSQPGGREETRRPQGGAQRLQGHRGLR